LSGNRIKVNKKRIVIYLNVFNTTNTNPGSVNPLSTPSRALIYNNLPFDDFIREEFVNELEIIWLQRRLVGARSIVKIRDDYTFKTSTLGTSSLLLYKS